MFKVGSKSPSRLWPVPALALPLLFTILAAPAALYAQAFDQIERDRAVAMLKAVKEELKNNYYDKNFGGLDVEARFKLSEERIKQASSLGQAFGVIAQTLLDLNDSHTFFLPPERSVKVEYGWQMQMVGDRCFVSAIRPGSDAEKKGLKLGDLILSVENFKPARKDMWKLEYYYYTLSPRAGLRVVAQSPGAEPRQLDLAAKVKQEKRVLDLTSSIEANEYLRDSEDSYRLKRHRFQKFPGLVIWKMPGFDFEPAQVDAIMGGAVKGAEALILDLRGNPGGYVVTLEKLVSHFFDQEVKIADLVGRKEEMKPMVAKRRSNPFAGKVVVLIDSASGSAAEIFARVMQLEKRGVVIGDQSSGSVMQSRRHVREFGNDSRVVLFGASVTNADVIMKDGRSIERVGVTPDERLLPTAEDLAAGRDPVLAKAAAMLGVPLDPVAAGKLFPIEWK